MGSTKKKSSEQISTAQTAVEPKVAGTKIAAVKVKPASALAPAKKASASATAAQGVVAAALPVTPAKRAARKSAAKVAQKAKPAPASVAPVSAKEPAKEVKAKLVRDSFTMPRADFDLIGKLKERALGFKQPVKKSELLRAGLHALHGLSDAKLKEVLGGLTPLKAGRPKKQGY